MNGFMEAGSVVADGDDRGEVERVSLRSGFLFLSCDFTSEGPVSLDVQEAVMVSVSINNEFTARVFPSDWADTLSFLEKSRLNQFMIAPF